MLKKEYKEEKEKLGVRLGLLQRKLKDAKVPVLIVFDGYDAAGKGLQINRLIQTLDPRGFDVYTGDRRRGGADASVPLAVRHKGSGQWQNRNF